MTGIEQESWFGLVAHRGYDISSLGRVRSYWNQRVLQETPRLCRVRQNRKGYFITTVRTNGLHQEVGIHRIVLEAFVGPCPKGMVCRHLDGNPGNNRLDNLCWGTRKQNAEDAIRLGEFSHVSGTNHHKAKLDEAKVRTILKLHKEGRPAREIATEFDVTPSLISYVVNRKLWTHVAP